MQVIKRPKQRWSAQELAALDAEYPNGLTRDLAEKLGRSMSCVQKMAQMRGLKKTPEARSMTVRLAPKSPNAIATRFKPRHGHSQQKQAGSTYNAWQSMLSRCRSEKHKSFASYGGRGVTVCERWNDYINFLQDMGERPPGTSIDRINGDGNYEPGNCRWATPKEQAINRKSTVYVEAFGVRKRLAEWSEQFGVRKDTLTWRIRNGMPPEKALTTPVGRRTA